MKSNVKLASVDDLFSTEESRQDTDREKVVEIALSELHPIPNHPIKMRDDKVMEETIESVKTYGVLTPAIVRPRAEGGYEIIAGRRRKQASELAERETMPCIIRDMDDDMAVILMVDSNIQREDILPSERAQAYKMKLEAIKRRAGRHKAVAAEGEKNGSQVGTHSLDGKKSLEVVADEAGESKSQVHRYIRLTELSPELQQMVDDKKIAMTPAVELSYLKPEEQALMVETIESEQATPSLSQAQRIKKLSQSGELNEDTMLSVMSEQKKPEKSSITLSSDKISKYFPKSYTPRQMEDTIIKLLEAWMKKRQRSQER